MAVKKKAPFKSYIKSGTAKGEKKASLYRPYFKPRAGGGSASSWSVPDLCKAYNWPTGAKGGGVIGIVELGGGWTPGDMKTYFDDIGQPLPKIVDVSVDTTKNSPNKSVGSKDDPDMEVVLDIQVAAAAYYVATGQPATIKVYWARDIAPAVDRAVKDGCDVVSISWGLDEALWTKASLAKMERSAAAAAAKGTVVFAASGDNDSGDGGSNPANVDAPASCPHVVGCGGTRLQAGTETVWNNNPGNPSGEGTGGGFSVFFPAQSFQAGAPSGPGRMVPDVAANADPNTGYEIFVHGQPVVEGGTSAVAPLYAGLFAAFGKKLGFVSPILWKNHTCFNDITVGDNGAFRAGVGPDPCTGLGSPIGARLAALFNA